MLKACGVSWTPALDLQGFPSGQIWTGTGASAREFREEIDGLRNEQGIKPRALCIADFKGFSELRGTALKPRRIEVVPLVWQGMPTAIRPSDRASEMPFRGACCGGLELENLSGDVFRNVLKLVVSNGVLHQAVHAVLNGRRDPLASADGDGARKQQIRQGLPIWARRLSKLEVSWVEPSPIFGPVVDEQVPLEALFFVGQGQPARSPVAQVPFHPPPFVRPGVRLTPRGCGEEVHIIEAQMVKLLQCLDGAGKRRRIQEGRVEREVEVYHNAV